MWENGFVTTVAPPTLIDHAIDVWWGVYYRVRDFVMAPKPLREIRIQASVEAVLDKNRSSL